MSSANIIHPGCSVTTEADVRAEELATRNMQPGDGKRYAVKRGTEERTSNEEFWKSHHEESGVRS